MKKSLLLSCLLLFGCVKNSHTIEYAGKNFTHTTSLCLDALLVNMDVNQCVEPSISIEPGVMIVTCKNKVHDLENFWTDNLFFMLPTVSTVEAVNGELVCLDYNYALFVAIPEGLEEE